MPTQVLRRFNILKFLHLARALAVGCLALLYLRPAAAQDNGITVGQPKVYDNQSLTIMLEELSERLRQVNAIDPQALAKALGLTQGSQQQDVQRSFTLTVSPTPKAPSADSGGSTGTSVSNNSSASSSTGDSAKKSASASPSVSSSPPALPDLLTAPSYSPTYGENSLDLLSDQVDLTYQIFNLRMILERAVSDRLKDSAPRRQAILSFNVTLDPPKHAQNAAAYVEITLTTDRGPVSLVASMPQEKTYNATSLSSSSNAFGGSAVAKIVTIGYNQRRRSQMFFLYRDCDTLALERAPVGNAVTFGWVFRPVLGRKSVSPGMRQMFAVVALPETDQIGDDAKEERGFKTPHISVQAKTYWLRYDKSSLTTVRRPGFWDWSVKSLPSAEEHKLSNVAALPTETVENALRPSIDSVQLFATTNGNTVLQIQGQNFFNGTSVTIGDKTFAKQTDGLFLKSSQTILLTANSDLLSRSFNAVVNGRYGPAVPLYPHASPEGIVIAKSSLQPDGPSVSQLELIIGDADPKRDFLLDEIRRLPRPILLFNGTPVPFAPSFVRTRDQLLDPGVTHDYVVATTTVPNSLIHADYNRAGIVFPLLGQPWSAEDVIRDSDQVQVTKMTAGTTTTILLSRPGAPFNKDWQVVLDKLYRLGTESIAQQPSPTSHPPGSRSRSEQHDSTKAQPRQNPVAVQFYPVLPCKTDPHATIDCYVLKLVGDTKFLGNYKKFLLISPVGHTQILDLPAAEKNTPDTPSSPPKVTSLSPATVGINEVVTLTIVGTGLDAIKQISFEGKNLVFWSSPSKDKDAASQTKSDESTHDKTGQIQVLLTRDVTGKEGHQELLLQVDAKTMATATVTVAAAPTAAKGQQPERKGKP